MTPTQFPEQNNTLHPSSAVYSNHVLGVEPLPVWSDGEQSVSCWRMSWRERLSALIFGRAWLSILSGGTQPPAYVEASRSYFARGEQCT